MYLDANPDHQLYCLAVDRNPYYATEIVPKDSLRKKNNNSSSIVQDKAQLEKAENKDGSFTNSAIKNEYTELMKKRNDSLNSSLDYSYNGIQVSGLYKILDDSKSCFSDIDTNKEQEIFELSTATPGLISDTPDMIRSRVQSNVRSEEKYLSKETLFNAMESDNSIVNYKNYNLSIDKLRGTSKHNTVNNLIEEENNIDDLENVSTYEKKQDSTNIKSFQDDNKEENHLSPDANNENSLKNDEYKNLKINNPIDNNRDINVSIPIKTNISEQNIGSKEMNDDNKEAVIAIEGKKEDKAQDRVKLTSLTNDFKEKILISKNIILDTINSDVETPFFQIYFSMFLSERFDEDGNCLSQFKNPYVIYHDEKKNYLSTSTLPNEKEFYTNIYNLDHNYLYNEWYYYNYSSNYTSNTMNKNMNKSNNRRKNKYNKYSNKFDSDNRK